MLWSDLVVSLSSKTWPASRDVSKNVCGVCGYARKNSHKWAPATSQRDFNEQKSTRAMSSTKRCRSFMLSEIH